MSDQVLITTSKLVSLADSVRSHASLSEKLKLPEIPGLIGNTESYTILDIYPSDYNWYVTTPMSIADINEKFPENSYSLGYRVRALSKNGELFGEDILRIVNHVVNGDLALIKDGVYSDGHYFTNDFVVGAESDNVTDLLTEAFTIDGKYLPVIYLPSPFEKGAAYIGPYPGNEDLAREKMVGGKIEFYVV